MGNVLQQALAGAPQGPGALPQAPPPPQAPIAQIPPPMPPADHIHHAKSQAFAHAAVASFVKGEITRKQLADALSDDEAYDWKAWKAANVIHPTRAGMSATMPPEEAHDSLTPMPSPPPNPIQGAGSI
jgi:hypothetical protein